MVDLAATFEENAMEAAAMVWRCERTPLALRKAVGLAAHKARGIVLSEPEFLGDTTDRRTARFGRRDCPAGRRSIGDG